MTRNNSIYLNLSQAPNNVIHLLPLFFLYIKYNVFDAFNKILKYFL